MTDARELPVPKLCNKIRPLNCPEKGDGPLGRKHNKDLVLTKRLQEILKYHGYMLGKTGKNGDGIDGVFGELTKKAVIDFQKKNKDWEGKQLKSDGLVGPKTADALNRAMVGIWYDRYQTPREITKDDQCHTYKYDLLKENICIEPGKAKKAKVILKPVKKDNLLQNVWIGVGESHSGDMFVIGAHSSAGLVYNLALVSGNPLG